MQKAFEKLPLVATGVRLAVVDFDRLETVAASRNIAKTAVIRLAVQEFLEKNTTNENALQVSA